MTQSERTDYQDSGCIDHTDPETLRRLYWGEGLSTREIAELTEYTSGAINNQMEKHGIERRSISEALKNNYAGYETTINGYERWRDETIKESLKVHRLLAVAEYGFDAIVDKHIHHENGLSWDNRPENLTPLTPGEHQREHNDGEKSPNAKLTREQAKEIKKHAKAGDRTHQEIADEYGVERSLVTMIKSGRRWTSLE